MTQSSPVARGAYRSGERPVAHGIMLHHFHSEQHAAGQGSLSAEEFDALLDFLGPERVLAAGEWQERAEAGRLRPGDLCITFDDSLQCQYDVAAPVLAARGLTAFWFVYTSVFEGALERLELYRTFRCTRFPSVDAFYDEFFQALRESPFGSESRDALAAFDPGTYLQAYPFYSDSDRRFRFVRDDILGPGRYHALMDAVVERSGSTWQELAAGLWMKPEALQRLQRGGHVIGLHTHTHPTRLNALSAADQYAEYSRNQTALADILGQRPTAMSHPCNSYNQDTLTCLGELGVRVGFRSNMALLDGGSLEYPREDHANILRMMGAR